MIAQRIDRYVALHYAGVGGVARWRRVYAHKVTLRTDPKAAADRLHVDGRDLDKNADRTYRAERLLEAADAETGEILNLESFFHNLGFPPTKVLNALIPEPRRLRTVEHGLSFDGHRRGLLGWAFHVPPPFRAGLDLTQTPNGKRHLQGATAGSQGWPPAYSFSQGDSLYDHSEVRHTSWGQALRLMSEALQVVAATADVWNQDQTITPGELTFAIRRVDGGRLLSPETVTTTQAGFVHYLRYRYLPD